MLGLFPQARTMRQPIFDVGTIRSNANKSTFLFAYMQSEKQVRVDNQLKELGLRLKDARLKKYGSIRGSAKKCAAALSMSPSAWSGYEAGRTEIGFTKLLYFADFFDIDAGWLLTGHEPQAKTSPTALAGDESTKRLFSILSEAHKALVILAESVATGEIDPAVAQHSVEEALKIVWQAHGKQAQAGKNQYSKTDTHNTGIA